MEKFCSKVTFCKLIVMVLFAFCGFNQKTHAQFPTVSTEGNEVWYYIEQGHSAAGHITNNDGRFCSVISSNGNDMVADIDLIRPSAQRGSQKWKLVAVPDGDGFYYFINQNGEYLYRNEDTDAGKNQYSAGNVPAYLDKAKFKYTSVSGTKYFYITRKGESSKILEALGGGGNFWTLRDNTGNPAKSGSYNLTNSPRAWRFVPIADIDDFYPEIFAQGTAVGDVVSWYFIKSFDPTAASAPYLTLKEDKSGFELQEKNPITIEAQLFGFISNGKKAVGTGVGGGHVTCIVNKSDLTKYLNQATAGVAYEWYIEHVVKPDEGIMQNTIRVNRDGNFLISDGISIVIEPASSSNHGNSATIDTYDSKYNWAFEPAPNVEVTVTDGDNITLEETVPSEVAYDHSIKITYTVSAGYAPIVTINTETGVIGTLTNTDASGNKTYELTVSHITEATTVSISAEGAIPVTVNATHVKILSPTLVENQYTSASSSVITFSLNAGYENPTVTLNSEVYDLGDPVDGVYSITLTDITDAVTVNITATIIRCTISWTAVEGVEITTEGTSATVDYGITTTYAVYFKLAPGYHSPKVFVNGINQTVNSPNENGIYTVFLMQIKEDKAIEIWAFPANILPVMADTYVRGGSASSTTVFAGEGELRISSSTYQEPNYRYRTYMQFNIPQAIKDAGYNKVSLQLVFKGKDKPNTHNLWLEIRPSTINKEIKDMTWSENEETIGNLSYTDTIATKLLPYSDNSSHSIDISSGLTGNDLSSPIKLQLSANEAVLTTSDGWYSFYSLEGAVEAANINYIPVLIFEKTATPGEIVNVSNYIGYQGDVVFLSDDDGTGQLTAGADVSTTFQSPGKVKLIKTFQTDQWYPIGFPFEIDKNNITVKYGMKSKQGVIYDGNYGEPKFTEGGGSDGCNFFVKKYDADKNYFIFDKEISANTGYIVEFPAGEFDGAPEVEVTFVSSAESPTLTIGGTGGNVSFPENDEYSLVLNPNVSNITGFGNTANYYQYNYDKNDPWFLRLNENTLTKNLKPFEAIVAVKNGTAQFRSSIGDGSSGTTVLEPLPGVEEPQEVRYYTMQGVRIYSPQENGVYIVKKVYASGKTDISKAIYKNKGL
jgi:hypothetical protein